MKNGQNNPAFVVTVLKANTPLAVVTIVRDQEDSASVDVVHNDTAEFQEIIEALHQARHAVAYLQWKLTGQLPAPLDFLATEHPQIDDDRPF